MGQKGFIQIPILIAIIVGVLVLGGAYVAVKHFSQPIGQLSVPSSVEKSSQQTDNKKPLFGTMLAFDINEVARGTPGMLDAIRQKGWIEFRKGDSDYQNLLNNLKKIIKNNTKLVKTTGFSIDREAVAGYFTWNVIEPAKGQFDWELTDMYAQVASDAGIKISAVIQPFAGWDQKDTKPEKSMADFAYYDYKAGPPKDIAEYKNFLTKMVERYKNKVAVWEIGNEPENPGSGYQNNSEGYFDLVKITSETIKRADPKAIVTNGGAMPIVGMPEFDSLFKTYWTKFFTLGGNQYIDYFNIHYNNERSPGAKFDPAMFQEELTFFNNLMDKNGGRKPLYLTEFGIYSGAPSSQPPSQPVQGAGQVQTNLLAQLTQPLPSTQSPNQPSGDKCGDGICDDFEKQNPNACPKDCGGSMPSGNPEQPSVQPIQGQTPNQNIQPNQGQTLRKVSENDQAILYFKDSILAFANGVKAVFVDLIGLDGDTIGSSAAFNPEGQPRLFLATLKTIDSKIKGFSKAEKITDSQYKFTVDGKNIYALWSGNLPAEIKGQVRVIDINGEENMLNAQEIKFSSQNPVLVEI